MGKEALSMRPSFLPGAEERSDEDLEVYQVLKELVKFMQYLNFVTQRT